MDEETKSKRADLTTNLIIIALVIGCLWMGVDILYTLIIGGVGVFSLLSGRIA